MLPAADDLDNRMSRRAPQYGRFLNDNLAIQPSASRYDFVVFKCAMAEAAKFLGVVDVGKVFRVGPMQLPSMMLDRHQPSYALLTSRQFQKKDDDPPAYTWGEVKDRLNAAYERSHPVVDYID